MKIEEYDKEQTTIYKELYEQVTRKYNDLFIQQWKCSKCDAYLCPPLNTCVQGHMICGRCTTPPNTKPFVTTCPQCNDPFTIGQSKAFGKVLATLKFPCQNTYLGCAMQMHWTELEPHEHDKCMYRTIKCPLRRTANSALTVQTVSPSIANFDDLSRSCIGFKKCNWSGLKLYLYQHFEQSHAKSLIASDTNTFNLEVDIFLYPELSFVLNNMFVLFLVRDYSKLKILLAYLTEIDQNEEFRYKFIAHGRFKHNHLSLEATAEKFGNGPDIWTSKKTIHVLNNISFLFNANRKLECSITLLGSNLNEDTCTNHIFNANALNQLKCISCANFMIPPIYQCPNGHSICFTCELNHEFCSRCYRNLVYFTGRNEKLELLTARITYPCRNYRQGCPYVRASHDIRKHETYCQYGKMFACPMDDCAWIGMTSKFANHWTTEHHLLKVMMEVRGNVWRWTQPSGTYKYVHINNYGCFIVTIIIDHTVEVWSVVVQTVTVDAKKRQKFKYVVNFGEKNFHFEIMAVCGSSMVSLADIVKSGNFVTVTKESIKRYFNKDHEVSLNLSILPF